MEPLTHMIEYNDYCNELYISYITKHYEFIKFYTLIQKLLTINSQLSNNDSMVDILSILDNNNIDSGKLKHLLEQKKVLEGKIDHLQKIKGKYPEIDKKSSPELDQLVDRLDSGDEQCHHFKTELEKNKQVVEKLTSEKQQLQKKIDLIDKPDSLKDSNQKLTVELTTIKKKHTGLIEEKKGLEEKINKLTNTQQEMDTQSKITNDLKNKLQTLEKIKTDLETNNKAISTQLGKIKHSLDIKTKELEKNKIEIKKSVEMKSKLSYLTTKISNLENEKQVLNKAVENYKKKNTEMEQIEKQLKVCNETLLKETATAQQLNQEIVKLKKQITNLQPTTTISSSSSISRKSKLVEKKITLGNNTEMNYSYDRVSSNNLSKPLNLSNFNCGFSTNEDRKNKSLVASKEKKLMNLIQQSSDSIYYKTIYQNLLTRYQVGSTQERMDMHGESWGNLDFCKSKTIEWFCRYAKVGLIHHLLEDLLVLNKAREEINKWCKNQQTLKRQCPSPMCKPDQNTGKCRRKRTYYSNIKDDASKELRKQLYPDPTERAKVKNL